MSGEIVDSKEFIFVMSYEMSFYLSNPLGNAGGRVLSLFGNLCPTDSYMNINHGVN